MLPGDARGISLKCVGSIIDGIIVNCNCYIFIVANSLEMISFKGSERLKNLKFFRIISW